MFTDIKKNNNIIPSFAQNRFSTIEDKLLPLLSTPDLDYFFLFFLIDLFKCFSKNNNILLKSIRNTEFNTLKK